MIMLETRPIGRIKIRQQAEDIATFVSCSEMKVASRLLLIGALLQKRVKLGIEEARIHFDVI
jgi:hypothetical protein